jgi:hypothetical protein
MKSVKYEGFYHCMHNHLTVICSQLEIGELRDFLLRSRWMKKWQEEAGNNQLFI